MCMRHLPVNLIEPNGARAEANYKEIFVRLMKEVGRVERGKNFKTTSFGPVEIEAISTYKNIVATGEPSLLTS